VLGALDRNVRVFDRKEATSSQIIARIKDAASTWITASIFFKKKTCIMTRASSFLIGKNHPSNIVKSIAFVPHITFAANQFI
jgi:hypothetical protein